MVRLTHPNEKILKFYLGWFEQSGLMSLHPSLMAGGLKVSRSSLFAARVIPWGYRCSPDGEVVADPEEFLRGELAAVAKAMGFRTPASISTDPESKSEEVWQGRA